MEDTHLNLTKELSETDAGQAVMDLYRASQRPKLRTSSAYLFSRLQKKNIKVSKQEIVEVLKRLHDAGLGTLHHGSFYRQKFDWKVNPRSAFAAGKGNGVAHEVELSEKDVQADVVIDPPFNVNITIPVRDQSGLKKTISMLMDLLTN